MSIAVGNVEQQIIAARWNVEELRPVRACVHMVECLRLRKAVGLCTFEESAGSACSLTTCPDAILQAPCTLSHDYLKETVLNHRALSHRDSLPFASDRCRYTNLRTLGAGSRGLSMLPASTGCFEPSTRPSESRSRVMIVTVRRQSILIFILHAAW
jgi:hypothetical protein